MKNPQIPSRHVSLGGYAAKQCFELLRKNLDPAYLDEWKDEIDPFTQAIMDAGNDFERNTVRTALLEAMPNHLIIDTTVNMGPKRLAATLAAAREKALVVFDGTREESSMVLRETITHALCEQPGKVRVLWNPRLRKWRKDAKSKIVWTNRAAEPDLLFRQGPLRVSNSARWGSIDVKFHHPFEGKKKGLEWKCSTLNAPYPEKGVNEAWEGILKKDDAMQLAHYYRALEFHGLAGSADAGIIGKPLDGELKVVWLDLNDKLYERESTSALAMYDEMFAEAVAVAQREMDRMDDPSLEPLTGPEWKSECLTCVWRSKCHDELSLANHITLLPGVTPSRAAEHYAAGISEVRDLARLDTTTARAIDAGVSDLPALIDLANSGQFAASEPAHKLLSGKSVAKQSAALNNAGLLTVGDVADLDPKTAQYSTKVYRLVQTIDQARVEEYASRMRSVQVHRARGVDTLEIPMAPVEIHVDMENDEHIYLWGAHVKWRYKGGRVRPSSHSFVSWDKSDEGEARAFIEFWAWLGEMITKAEAQEGPNSVKIFHYTAAEDRCMRALAKKYEGVEGMPTPDEIEAFLASDVWVDLYDTLTDQLIWPTENMSLKSLAKYTGFEWRDDDPSGANSVVWYKIATDASHPDQLGYQQRIIDYNEDDCKATAYLLAWLQKYSAVHDLNKKLPSVVDLESKFKPSGAMARTKVAAKKR